jgi:hypothetical protein
MASVIEGFIWTQLSLFASFLLIHNFIAFVDYFSRLANSVWTVPREFNSFVIPVQNVLKNFAKRMTETVSAANIGFKDVILVAILFAIIVFRPRRPASKNH